MRMKNQQIYIFHVRKKRRAAVNLLSRKTGLLQVTVLMMITI